MKDKYVELFDDISAAAVSAPLSEVLPAVQRLAKGIGATQLLRWARLETDGYFRDNPAMADDIEVPQYRSVPGDYYDDLGRRLVVENPELSFIREDRLRFGVRQLEALVSRRETIRVQRTAAIDLVRESLRVDVTTFGFSATAVDGVLSSIRSNLVEQLADLEEHVDQSRTLPPSGVRIDRIPVARGWIGKHVVPIAVTVIVTLGAGLLVAFLSHLLGWV